MSDGYALREGAATDAAVVAAQRRAMFLDMGQTDGDAALDGMTARFLPWVKARLADGTYRAWFIEHHGEIVAGAGLWLKPVQPGGLPRWSATSSTSTPIRATRGKGLARRLMVAITTWCRDAGLDVVELHASNQGRPIYESLGFAATNEMRLILSAEERGG